MTPPPAPTRTVDGTHVRRRNWAGEPTLLLGEDARGYDELLAEVSRVLVPHDVIEDMWIRDVVDLAWDVLRLRRLKASLLRVRAREALYEVIEPLDADAFDLARGWFARDAAAVSRVERALQSAGLSVDAVMAATLRQEIEEIERIEAMIANAENRRGTALSEIERHRASFAEKLRGALDQVGNSAAHQPGGRVPDAAQRERIHDASITSEREGAKRCAADPGPPQAPGAEAV
jgi:hypothetical protein